MGKNFRMKNERVIPKDKVWRYDSKGKQLIYVNNHEKNIHELKIIVIQAIAIFLISSFIYFICIGILENDHHPTISDLILAISIAIYPLILLPRLVYSDTTRKEKFLKTRKSQAIASKLSPGRIFDQISISGLDFQTANNISEILNMLKIHGKNKEYKNMITYLKNNHGEPEKLKEKFTAVTCDSLMRSFYKQGQINHVQDQEIKSKELLDLITKDTKNDEEIDSYQLKKLIEKDDRLRILEKVLHCLGQVDNRDQIRVMDTIELILQCSKIIDDGELISTVDSHEKEREVS